GVRDDIDEYPSLPEPTHRMPGDTQTTLDTLDIKKDPVLVGDAISDLPDVTEDGVVSLEGEPENGFQNWVRNGDEVEVHNHVAKKPREKDMELVKRIPEGKMYRSSRFGDKYVQVWDLYDDILS
ncbi:MAG: hypothetical protein SXQ77_07585, partial [Halobacteria archaeon]|nr:hypothetical protein [Halobacteria archaeon]